ncbi:Uncharacterised protein [Vibrio cholerae]|nr:Uncharacterised protein [Vibrio cholerae]
MSVVRCHWVTCSNMILMMSGRCHRPSITAITISICAAATLSRMMTLS